LGLDDLPVWPEPEESRAQWVGYLGKRDCCASCGSPHQPCSPGTPPNFGSFNKTYGSLGAVIGFMTWIWLSVIVILIGPS
jgi:hypothetical protein